MGSHFRAVLGTVASIGVVMIFVACFHLEGKGFLNIGFYSPLFGAFIGGILTLIAVYSPIRQEENVEAWSTSEKTGWTLIGCGCLAWAIGECFWRYYQAIGQTPFPSLADLGYASFPPLVFAGLILLPSARSQHKRTFFFIDSLIIMGTLLSIAWFLLLGPLSQTPVESIFARVLGLYYPTMDTALLSCTIFLLLRGLDASRTRRISLLVVGFGLAIFATSDFIFNLQQNLGTYTDGTWVDLGWPLGLMSLGVAAYLRRFLSVSTDEILDQRKQQQATTSRFDPAQVVPYILLITLFCMLIFNVLSNNTMQQATRPVLVVATMVVIILVIARQILTIIDNTYLLQKQITTFQELERVNQSITERNIVLELGITHLKEVQARLANGEVHARASLVNGELWPLAVGLNLMADRMMHIEQKQKHIKGLSKAVEDFTMALEYARGGNRFILPLSCHDFPEMNRLLLVLGLQSGSKASPSILFSGSPQAKSSPSTFPQDKPVTEAPASPWVPLNQLSKEAHKIQKDTTTSP